MRRQATVEAIVEATVLLIKERSDTVPGTREIALKSGYSVGTIYNYFGSVDAIVGQLVHSRQKAEANKMRDIIFQHDCDEGVDLLCARVVERCFLSLQSYRPAVVRFVFSLVRKHSDKPDLMDSAMDLLIDPLLLVAERDRTGTFQVLNTSEIRMLLRGVTFVIRTPLLDASVFFATAEHRRIVTAMLTGGLSRLSASPPQLRP